MSGEKRTPIQIVRDEMHSMRNQVYNIQKHRERLEKNIKKAQQENRQHIQQLHHELEARDQKREQAINGLESDMKDLAQKHHQALRKQRKEFIAAQTKQRDELIVEIAESEGRSAKRIENLREWTHESLQSQRQEYLNIARQQQQQIDNIKGDIRVINQREENRQERASYYISDMKKLISAVDRDLFEKFALGKLEKVERQIALAEQQLASDIPSAAIGTAQSAHFALMDLDQEVQDKEAEFEMYHSTAVDAIAALLENVRENRQIQLEEDAATQEANYWTDGKYEDLLGRISKLRDRLAQDKTQLSLEEVNYILDNISELSLEQEATMKDAVERIISSQLRAEMGDTVVDALSQRGFRVVKGESGYSENDQRQPYLVKMHKKDGPQIVTVIAPDGESHKNIISVNTYGDRFHNEEAEQQRNTEIRQAFEKQGLKLGETECNDIHIAEFYDVKSIIEEGRGIPESVKKKAGILQK